MKKYTLCKTSSVCSSLILTGLILLSLKSFSQICSVSITASANNICAGTSVTFTATPTNGGANPGFQWKLDGNHVGNNSSTYSYYPINNDTITCILTSSDTSVTSNPATSNKIIMTVYTQVTYNNINQTQSVDNGMSITLTANCSGSPPVSYQWYKNDSLLITGSTRSTFTKNSVNCSDSGQYSCDMINVCNEIKANIVKLVVLDCSPGKYSVSGNVTYMNIYSTRLPKINVYLSDSSSGVIIDSTITDNNGFYIFENVINGSYKTTCKTKLPWGGANPIDALLVARYYIKLHIITDSLLLKAADVLNDKKINPIDALMICRRYISLQKAFNIPDWLFTNPSFHINGANFENNIKAVCAGDVNGSDGTEGP